MKNRLRLNRLGENNNSLYQKIIAILIVVSFIIFISIIIFPKKSQTVPASIPQALGETRTTVLASPPPSPSIQPSPSVVPSPQISPRPSPGKNSYIIAAFGDSMVDTMGENLDYLDKAMMARYPTTKFKFYNYGIGSQNVLDAYKRFDDPLVYKDRNYPPLNQVKPDVIIISSFAYNPLSPYDKSAYLKGLKDIYEKSKQTGAKVYILAEIAPLKTGFGKGIGGVNWSDAQTKTHVGYILENLNGAVNFALSSKIPLINAFEESKVDGEYGNKLYVGTHDGIHPSIEGEVFMANIIADTLVLP